MEELAQTLHSLPDHVGIVKSTLIGARRLMPMFIAESRRSHWMFITTSTDQIQQLKPQTCLGVSISLTKAIVFEDVYWLD